MWVSASEEDNEDVRWNSSRTLTPLAAFPSWYFPLAAVRSRDQNMEALTQQIATQRVVSAEVAGGGRVCSIILMSPSSEVAGGEGGVQHHPDVPSSEVAGEGGLCSIILMSPSSEVAGGGWVVQHHPDVSQFRVAG
ncbi:Filensin [Dissostichus eleginoides]|uniref:Filensin n=1 Tax=Dissostichus eleginoides TaxID=100907 RepID=A0AAD9BPA1_DISEL|nr:Filensin [Dissostichus eleginoides]